jgi:tetratricopeptide (TPR) repeat protein
MTINWGMGFFLGLKFGFILIVLAIEFYFLVLDKYTENESSKIEFFVLTLISFLCIIIPVVQLTRFSVGLWTVIPVPLFYAIFRIMENTQIKREDEKLTGKDIRTLEKRILKNPEIPETYLMLGDIYFKKNDYERALRYYKKAFSIRETSELQQKIKITYKEYRIQKGEIWVCGECGADNPGSVDRCRVCGNSNKPVTSIKEDLIKNKRDIKRWIINGLVIPFGALLLLVLLKNFLPSTAFIFLSICISLAVIYILLREILKW